MPNQNINRRVVLANGMRLDPSTQSVVDRMAALGSAPSAARQLKMNDLVLNLKGQGIYGSVNVWNKLDILQPYYAETEIQALVEWKMKDGAGVYDATLQNTVTFSANDCFILQPGASSNHIITNFRMTNGTNYTRNAASIFCYIKQTVTGPYLLGNIEGGFGAVSSYLRMSTTTTDQSNNGSTFPSGGYGGLTEGLYGNNRGSSTTFKTIKNDTIISTIAQTSQDISTSTKKFIITNNNLAIPTKITAFIAGGDLEADRSQLYNSLLAYIS